MDLPLNVLTAALHFSEDDIAANRNGEYSTQQRSTVALLGKVARAQRRLYPSLVAVRSATAPLPKIHSVSGRVHVVRHTRFVCGKAGNSGHLAEYFYLIVHSAHGEVEMPVTSAAMDAFLPDHDYTVYYYFNEGRETFLSADIVEQPPHDPERPAPTTPIERHVKKGKST